MRPSLYKPDKSKCNAYSKHMDVFCLALLFSLLLRHFLFALASSSRLFHSITPELHYRCGQRKHKKKNLPCNSEKNRYSPLYGRKLQLITLIVFYDTPSAKCDVYSVPKGNLKILVMLWEQDRCKDESKRERKRERPSE